MLKLEKLSKRFVMHQLGGNIIEAFRDVVFQVPQGCSLGISGPSGSGKSSVLKCIFRTYLPTEGDIWYDSTHFGNINLARESVGVISRVRELEIGMITQFLKVIPRVSALDVVAEPLVNSGMARDAARRQAAAMLDRLGIPSRLFDAYPTTFSGGEQQRVNVARAVIKAPRLLILDEPTASLDPRATGVVLDILKSLREIGTTMIGIFHQPEILTEFSDTIYSMPTRNVSRAMTTEELSK